MWTVFHVNHDIKSISDLVALTHFLIQEYDYADLEKMADASGSSEEEEFDEHMFDDIDSDDPDVNKGSDQDDEYDDEEEEEEEDEDGKPKKGMKRFVIACEIDPRKMISRYGENGD